MRKNLTGTEQKQTEKRIYDKKSRQEKIHSILISQPFTSLEELETMFPHVSQMTIRRDVAHFAKNGDVVQVRGGARAMQYITLTLEESYAQRLDTNTLGKERIARAAMKYAESERSLYFDSGSTINQMVSLLPDIRLNALTSDPNIAATLAMRREDNCIYLTGGMMNPKNKSLSGRAALKTISLMNIDVAFISPTGVTVENGFTCGHYDECECKQAAIERARKTVLLVSFEKFGRSMPNTFANFKDIDVLITDKDPGNEIRKACQKERVELIVANGQK